LFFIAKKRRYPDKSFIVFSILTRISPEYTYQHEKPAGGRCANDVGDSKSVINEALFQYYGVIIFLQDIYHKKTGYPGHHSDSYRQNSISKSA
jgi:hypothetical protein